MFLVYFLIYFFIRLCSYYFKCIVKKCCWLFSISHVLAYYLNYRWLWMMTNFCSVVSRWLHINLITLRSGLWGRFISASVLPPQILVHFLSTVPFLPIPILLRTYCTIYMNNPSLPLTAVCWHKDPVTISIKLISYCIIE